MEIITGIEALTMMRNVANTPNAHFSMVHLKYNQKSGESGVKYVKKAGLRPALPDDVFETDADLYLPYTDLEEELPKMCFKVLIRRVAFPPEYEWKIVKWFENEE